MTQEEKAKAYEGNYKTYIELINRLEDVKNVIKKQNYGIAMDIICKPYPEYQITASIELKESEDELHRKWILEYLYDGLLKSDEQFKDHFKAAIAWLEKQGNQKPADKVEPKFHEGEWLVHKDLVGVTCCIAQIHAPHYYLTNNNSFIKFGEEDNYRPWTIKDAKDGDVLHSPSHHLIWIYKDNEHYHACVNMNYVTENVATDGLISIPNDACPATKDEQTILFARMKEAGCEWNTDEKKLKKIEQKPTEPIKEYDFHGVNIVPKFKKGDLIREKNSGRILTVKEFSFNTGLYTYDTGQFPITIQDNYELVEQKSAWSKEDEEHIESILKRLDGMCKKGATFTRTCFAVNQDMEWLKSLRSQNRWKPSDEQMERLKGTINSLPHQEVLYSLYQDLKKLRGE